MPASALAFILMLCGSSAFSAERYVRPGQQLEAQFSSVEAIGAPRIVEGRVTPPVFYAGRWMDFSKGPDAMTVFEQDIAYSYRLGELRNELVSPDGAYRLPVGTRLQYRMLGEQGEWCTVETVPRGCLIDRAGVWTWRQEPHLRTSDQLASLGRWLILQPGKMGLPPLNFPVPAPRVTEHAGPRLTRTARVAVKLQDGAPKYGLRLQIGAPCPADDPQTAARPFVSPPCYGGANTPAELMEDMIFVGGENTGARLHYNAQDRTFMVTRVILDPATDRAR